MQFEYRQDDVYKKIIIEKNAATIIGKAIEDIESLKTMFNQSRLETITNNIMSNLKQIAGEIHPEGTGGYNKVLRDLITASSEKLIEYSMDSNTGSNDSEKTLKILEKLKLAKQVIPVTSSLAPINPEQRTQGKMISPTYISFFDSLSESYKVVFKLLIAVHSNNEAILNQAISEEKTYLAAKFEMSDAEIDAFVNKAVTAANIYNERNSKKESDPITMEDLREIMKIIYLEASSRGSSPRNSR